ncbi:hypothetical protein [Nitrospira sp. Kam-Ns4a]
MTRSRAVGVALTLLVGFVPSGCASLWSFEQAKKEAEAARQAYEQEVRRSEELTVQTRKLKEELDLLELKLKAAQADAARRTREYQEVREALAQFKGFLEGRGQPGPAGPAAAPTQPAKPAQAPPLEETKARLRDLLRELQTILER